MRIPVLALAVSWLVIALWLPPAAAQAPVCDPSIEFVDLLDGGSYGAVAVDGNVVYTNVGGLFLTVDFTDRSNPRQTSFLRLHDNIRDIQRLGNLAYAAQAGWLDIVDVADPANPVTTGFAALGEDPRRMTISGSYGFVAEGWGGVRVLDLTDPLNPDSIAQAATGQARYVAVAGTHAYVAELSSGLRILDISNPAAPTTVGQISRGSYAAAVAVSGDHAYVACSIIGSGLWVVNIQDPASPSEAGFVGTSEMEVDIAIDGDLVYTADVNRNMSVFDVSTPSTPTRIAIVEGGGTLALSPDSTVYAAGDNVNVFDVGDPHEPTIIGQYGRDATSGITGDGAYLYLRRGKITTMDRHYHDVHSAVYAGRPASDLWGFELSWPYLYVATCDSWYFTDGGLVIVDVSDPAAPTEVGRYPTSWTGGCYREIAVHGDRAYATEMREVRIMDISDVTAPTLIGEYGYLGEDLIQCIDADANYVYLGLRDTGLKIVDVSDPLAPFEAGHYYFGDAEDVAVAGDYAFVGGEDPGTGVGFRVIDVSDRTSPTEVASHTTNGDVRGVTLVGDLAYLTGSQLTVLDVSDPTNPVEVGACTGWFLEADAAAIPPYVYAAAGGHVLIFNVDLVTGIAEDVHPPLSLQQNFPNPFNPTTTITFELPTRSHVRIDVFDVRGRPVATLFDGITGPGPGATTWNGKDARGREVPSGVYLYRIDAGGFSQTRKMVILR